MITQHEKKNETWALVLASIASFMVVLDSLVVSVTLSTIRKDLGASIEELEWTVNAYSLSFAVLLLTAAAIGDRFGRRRMFIAGLLLFIAASVVCALSTSISWLIMARVIQGAGAAFVMPLAMSLLAAAIPPERRARALGIFTGITGLAVLSGPVVGGAVTEGLAWQWIFWLNVPIGLALIPLVMRRINESYGGDVSLDIKGFIYATLASFGLAWGLVRGNQSGWLSTEVLAAFALGILFLIVFVRWEKRAAEPMVPMRFFRSRNFSAGSVASFLLFAAMFGTVFFVAQFLQIEQGYSPLDAGLRVVPWTATVFIIAPISGSLVNKIGERPLVFSGLLLQGLGFLWLAAIATPETPYLQMILPFILTGTGTSLAMPALQTSVINSVAKSEVGKASGVFNMLRQLGAVFGIAILVVVFTSNGNYKSAALFNSGFTPAVYTSAILSLIGALAGLLLPGRQIAVRPALREV
jgi:EmrB/QacA subfamily drug resistance transporter